MADRWTTLEKWPPGATEAVWSDQLQRWFYTKPGSDPAEEQMMYAEHPEIPYPCFREEGKRGREAGHLDDLGTILGF